MQIRNTAQPEYEEGKDIWEMYKNILHKTEEEVIGIEKKKNKAWVSKVTLLMIQQVKELKHD